MLQQYKNSKTIDEIIEALVKDPLNKVLQDKSKCDVQELRILSV